MTDATRILLIGYGNPARGDDGLGPALARAIAAEALPAVTVEWPYHLQVEDAATIADHALVVFADADATGPAPFSCRRVDAAGAPSWTTHALAPEAALALARDVFDATPHAVLVGVRGEAFEPFVETLTPDAEANLAAALAWLVPRLRDGGRDLLAPAVAATTEG